MNGECQKALKAMNNRNGQKKTMSKYPSIFKGLLLIQAAEDQGRTVGANTKPFKTPHSWRSIGAEGRKTDKQYEMQHSPKNTL